MGRFFSSASGAPSRPNNRSVNAPEVRVNSVFIHDDGHLLLEQFHVATKPRLAPIVVDVSDLAAPVEVASFGVPGDSPHNFWVDEDRAVLFAAWYSLGIRALDVSGTLEGRLEEQGRELGSVVPTGPRGRATMWAPQLHGGFVYAADQNNGLWVLAFRTP